MRRLALIAARAALVGSLLATAVVLHLPAPSGVNAEARGTVRSAWSAAGNAADALSPFVPDLVDPLLSDKTLHFGLFFVVAVLWASCRALRDTLRPRAALLIVLALSVYAGVGELAQIAEGRIADWGDWAANVCGALVGVTAVAGVELCRRTMVRGREGIEDAPKV